MSLELLSKGCPKILSDASSTRPSRRRACGWKIEDNTVMSARPLTDRKLIFGNEKWGDYEGKSGISQIPVRVRKGESYTGSLYVKGTSDTTAKVRLVDEAGKEVFATSRHHIGLAWKKEDFQFMADWTAENSVFEVALAGSGDVLK